MTMATFHLQIVTPDRLVFDGEARQIILRTVGGDAAILAGHIDYSAPLGIGEAKLTDTEGKERTAACQGGLVTVSGGQVWVMATTFEWADEIDAERAQRARQEAEERLRALDRSDEQFRIAEAKLKRALTRLHVRG